MTYQVIARKWRPQTFEEVTGQEAITRTLHNAIEHDRLHHAYIFSGSRGVGKTTTARLLAKSLNCHKSESPTPTPCNAAVEDPCVSCREIAESRSIDVLEFDAASHTGVDDVREIIIEGININPARDRFKIFIIDEVHMLSKSSFNALLKTLEEPPPRVAFVMATTELHKLPDTILSRCQEFEFRSIPLNKIFERLKVIGAAEKIKISDGALREIARSGEGSMRDAQSNFDQVISFSGDEIETDDVVRGLGIADAAILTKAVAAIVEKNHREMLEIVDNLIGRGHNLRNFCRDLLSFFRDLLVVKLAGDVENLLDTSILDRNELQEIARLFSEADLIRFFHSLSETEIQIQDSLQPRYLVEIGLIKLIEMKRVTPIEDLLERISQLEAALRSAPGNIPKTPDTGPAVEKKTLNSEVLPEDAPFPAYAGAPETGLDGYKSEAVSISPIKESYEADNGSAEFETRSDEIEDRPLKSAFAESLKAEFLDSVPFDLSPLSDEELEHIEDKWLDAAYEKKLLLSGDDLNNIKTSSIIAQKFTPQREISKIADEDGSDIEIAVRNPAPQFVPPAFDDGPDDIYQLPVDPGPEDLRKYAETHPLVKKALRIFRGEIKEIKPTGDNGKPRVGEI